MRGRSFPLLVGIVLSTWPWLAEGATDPSLQQGLRYFHQGYIQKAIPFLEKAASASNQKEQALLWLAKAYQKQGGATFFEKAKQRYQQVLLINPHNTEAQTALGELLSWEPATRNHAIELLAAAHEANPKDPHVTQLFVQALAWQSQFLQAVPLLQTLEGFEDNHPTWLATTALVWANGGHPERALQIYEEKLHVQQSTDSKLRLNYAVALLKNQQEEAAQQVYQSLKETAVGQTAPPDWEYLQALSGLAYSLGDYGACFDWDSAYRKALSEEIYQNNTGLQLRMARSLVKLEREVEAVEFYEPLYLAHRLSLEEDQEFLDLLKSLNVNLAWVESEFKKLLEARPKDFPLQGAYAEFLSWQENRRLEAIERYFSLIQADPEQSPLWQSKLEQVLSWEPPQAQNIGLYQRILEQLPASKAAKLSLAKAYQASPKTRTEAMALYQELHTAYPEDGQVTQAWASALVSDPKNRDKGLDLLEEVLTQNPDSIETRLTYAQVLSYNHQFKKALEAFDIVLAMSPGNRQAWLGKGLTFLWSGQPLVAKRVLVKASQEYPKDVEILMALAQVEKALGRYDHALKILDEIRKQSLNIPTEAWILCAHEGAPQQALIYDFSILPYDQPIQTSPPPKQNRIVQKPVALQAIETEEEESSNTEASPFQVSPKQPEPKDEPALQEEMDSLNQATETLKQLQAESSREMQDLKTSLEQKTESLPEPVSLDTKPEMNNAPSAGQEVLEQASALEQGTDLLSGKGRLNLDQMGNLEQAISRDLRPSFRFGYQFLTQDGEPSTNRLRGYHFPNQLSIALTPQIRVRGGAVPRKIYMPRAKVSPSSTSFWEYTLGATARVSDRVTLDGDLGLTNFEQSDTTNLTYQVNTKIDLTDRIHLKLGSRRLPLENSLLSWAGIRPSRGPFAGDLVGQARENTFFAELNTNPFQNVDFNLGYEFGVVTGSEIRSNFKNQAYTSFGYTAQLSENHRARLGYEFLFFSYSKNATLGYFDLMDSTRRPLSVVNPITLAPRGSTFGGYFSPEQFYQNSLRLDLYGNFFNKRIEYKVGGSLGIQTYTAGHGIHVKSPASLASAFDGNVVVNMTDWLAMYGNVDFLDSGGLFQRWRVGGGLIVRPTIQALSPVFGKP